MNKRLFIYIGIGFILLGLGAIKKPPTYIPVENSILSDTIPSGKELATLYCSMCHLFPEPALLDKKTWIENVLPNMGWRLGIKEPDVDPYKGLEEEEVKIMRPLGIYPDTPLLTTEQWNSIVAYYENEAPEEPKQQQTDISIINKLPNFKTEEIFLGDKPMPQTSMLKYDKKTYRLYVGDKQNTLYILDSRLRLKNTLELSDAPVDIDFPKNESPRLLTIGTFQPSDQKKGRLTSLYKTKKTAEASVNINALPRPVQFATGDLNQDDKEDVVICGFGNNIGKLFWYDNFDTTKEHVLKALPGARKVEIRDLNNDNMPDIMALMTQSHEQITIFYNLGGGKFKEKSVLNFTPVFGASYFELVDFNMDGHLDILLTNGDNWDYSVIRKNYHGVRIYYNDGLDNFKEVFFYPLYGANKAVARDFDNDGDLDIAAVSFYSDLDVPGQAFIYLSNEGRMNFKAFSTPAAAVGKWLTMEVEDFDNDGDLDIVLGSYFQTLSQLTKLAFKGVLSYPQLLLLTNEFDK